MQGLCPGHPCFLNLMASCGKGPSHQSYKGFSRSRTLSLTERNLRDQQTSLILCISGMFLWVQFHLYMHGKKRDPMEMSSHGHEFRFTKGSEKLSGLEPGQTEDDYLEKGEWLQVVPRRQQPKGLLHPRRTMEGCPSMVSHHT